MSVLEEKLAALRALIPVREETVDDFLGRVSEVVDLSDSQAIPDLLMLMDDNCPLSGVMDAVSRNLEDFPPKEYVGQLLNVLPRFYAQSPFWCENEIRKLLWSEPTRALLADGAAAASAATQAALTSLLQEIQRETPKLVAASAVVLARLG